VAPDIALNLTDRESELQSSVGDVTPMGLERSRIEQDRAGWSGDRAPIAGALADAPGDGKAADANDDGGAGISDAVYSLGYLFLGGPTPPAPYPGCGTESTEDALGCEDYPGC
jgi:hypothetical protein